jgi:peptide/nickel transport system ATP-binding protein
MSDFTIEKLTIKHNDKFLVDLLSKMDRPLSINNSMALVGQSGSGKSLTIKSILNLLPKELNSNINFKCDFELTYNNIGFINQSTII